ncbi:MAG: 16S rRNA (guanine(966)-N(2))-methyltransferase RsmD [Thiogranum sp.]|nr:16S rRNA (guanine(966)-N(2))-methyltransferase RsmD [Thiogranum sp.]
MNSRPNQVRIIGGQWRGRKLPFPDHQGLRPTADRIRETLFNWLAPLLPGARCLDLFAGSGALGFEAASRGAAKVVLVENNAPAVQVLLANKQRLDAGAVDIVHSDARQYLTGAHGAFDIVFLDPPFDNPQLRLNSLHTLLQCDAIKPGGYLYMEMRKRDQEPDLPENLVLEKRKMAGQVVYQLYHYLPGTIVST